MSEEVNTFYDINNIQPTPLYDFAQWFFIITFVIFLILFIWSLVMFIRERKLHPTSHKFLPRVLGFVIGMLLATLSFVLTFTVNW